MIIILLLLLFVKNLKRLNETRPETLDSSEYKSRVPSSQIWGDDKARPRAHAQDNTIYIRVTTPRDTRSYSLLRTYLSTVVSPRSYCYKTGGRCAHVFLDIKIFAFACARSIAKACNTSSPPTDRAFFFLFLLSFEHRSHLCVAPVFFVVRNYRRIQRIKCGLHSSGVCDVVFSRLSYKNRRVILRYRPRGCD